MPKLKEVKDKLEEIYKKEKGISAITTSEVYTVSYVWWLEYKVIELEKRLEEKP